jgi:DNA polymerase-1
VPAVPAPGERGAVLQALSAIVESRERPKTGQDVKADVEAFLREGLKPAGFEFDTMIAAFLLQPDRSTYAVPALAREYLGEEGPREPAGAVRDARQRTFDDADLRRAARSAARDADVTLRLADVLDRRLAVHGLADLFRTIDMPLVDVLVSMEMTGVRIDVPLLERMSREMGGAIETLRAEIHRLAGHEFNVDSPIQLGRVLFEEIGLKPVSRTAKSGAASTRDEDLEALAAQHPLAARVREYRTLAKLRSTYVDALPQMVDPSTGRVHTSFHPTGASTGRLSSSDPNLQNIPVRTLEGRKIRAAFVPEPGWILISADYSQVELRVMAHMTGDPDPSRRSSAAKTSIARRRTHLGVPTT